MSIHTFPKMLSLRNLNSSVGRLQLIRAFSSVPKPTEKPSDPKFGSGPCKKRPGYDLSKVLADAPLGRSHRSKLGKNKLKEAIDKSKALLGVPAGYHLGIVPGSDTGAFEMAMWSMLGAKPVDVFQWESFGKGWVTDINSQLKIKDTIVHEADYGKIPDLSKARKDADVVFTFNGTTSGVRVPDDGCAFISKDRTGLTFCDATSAVFAMNMPWEKLDVVTYSWQKVLGGEGAHGVLILSPRAVQRLESYKPTIPLPKVFRMVKKGVFEKEIFEGSTINTPSMLCVEDYIDALNWAQSIGGLKQLIKISQDNLKVLEDFVAENKWIEFLAQDKKIRSSTSICFKINDLDADGVKKFTSLLEKENVALDIGSYRDAPAGLRIWGGATVETSDMKKLMPWLKWAHAQVKGN